ncbi:MAG: hypothetical protein M3Q07_09275 [Pseudobdellovibrionaceae bacterium]|nr:hypothetical protein [Pseudobdellovibrionaceae bacterium]
MIYYNLWAQGIGGLMFGDLTEALLITPGLCSLYLSIGAMGLFVLRFFDAKRKLSPAHYGASKVVVLIVFMNAVLSLFHVNYLVGIITGLPIILLIVILSIKLAIQRFRPAIFFLVSFMPLGSSMVFIAISYLTNSSHMMFALDLLTLGILLEAGLLSAAIGDKFAITLREKNRNILLESNSRQHAFKQLEKMVYPHQIELIKSGAELEETMATGQGEGCVLALDIIESSKIDHALAKEFFRNLFRACNEAMMEGYDGKRLQARAYRVKEMGDGFLCSVGYPFKSRTGNIANDAVELALRFIEILDHEAKILQPDEPICCGVGIALGNIAGFFPETGTKEYDLYGPGIVLATRYEAMCKLIFKDKPAGSVLILQERVYKSIDKAMRKHFQLVELSPESVFVRDDPGAHRLYYRMLGPEEGKSGFEDEQPGQEAGESPRRFHVAR